MMILMALLLHSFQTRLMAVAITSGSNRHTSAIVFCDKRAFLFDGNLLQDSDKNGLPQMLEVTFKSFREILFERETESCVFFPDKN
jgi:hypothetical protein